MIESIGPYRVLAKLGEGGMGEVYRARDTKLDRDVAIKVLPEQFVSDPERIARFQREAKTLASLNHPNIGGIYGLEDASGVKALVLELVDGPTLADIIEGSGLKAQGSGQTAQGSCGLPIDEALTIARQIIDALEAAHEQGIIHRDLKPANIKLRPDGTVKVLDFGLAKAMDPAGRSFSSGGGEAGPKGPAYNLSMSPTITSPAMTMAGVILGTAAYMSPEQARGRTADKRSDVWAFGCVLYEMLTGKRAFEGEDVSDTLALVLRGEPDWNAFPASVPPNIRAIVKRCLQRDRKARIPDMSVVRFMLDEPAPATDAASTPGRARATRVWLASSAAGVLLVTTLAAISFAMWRPTGNPTRLTRLNLTLPDGMALAMGASTSAPGAAPGDLSISPDGMHVALLLAAPAGRSRIFVRDMDALGARELPGTDGASGPFWSPDSRSIGFFADGKIKRVNLDGGPPVSLCDSPDYRGGAWGDGVIVFAPSNRTGLMKVSASGGTPTPATTTEKGEVGHGRPTFLPDGHHFLFGVYQGGNWAATIDGPERVLVIPKFDAMNVGYAQGQLLFVRGNTLMAQPFDDKRLALSGDAIPIAEQVHVANSPPIGSFAVSWNGVLVFLQGSSSTSTQIAWFDRSGKMLRTVGDVGDYDDLWLSHDGKRATVTLPDPAQKGLRDIWMIDVARGARTRFTFDPASDITPVWSPDDRRIVFSSNRRGHYDLYAKASNGSGDETLLYADGRDKFPMDWLPDGRLIYMAQGGSTGRDLLILPLTGDRKPVPLLQSRFDEWTAQVSPDGKWLAYSSNESGAYEVYVAPVSDPSAKTIVSADGGVGGQWRPDGKAVLFSKASGDSVIETELHITGARADVSAPRTLFNLRAAGQRSSLGIAADGEMLAAYLPDDTTATRPITVVQNWPALLKK